MYCKFCDFPAVLNNMFFSFVAEVTMSIHEITLDFSIYEVDYFHITFMLHFSSEHEFKGGGINASLISRINDMLDITYMQMPL